jgi:hypothetical protein
MDDIRIFIRRIASNNYSLNIKYNDDNTTTYIYKINNNNKKLIFNESNDNITLKYDNKMYDNNLDISLILFDLFNYKNIEYIDIYLQKKIKDYNLTYPINELIIDDIYNDNYDDETMILTCIRNINNFIKIKLIIDKDNNFSLFYNLETISGFDNIIKKIDEIISVDYLNQIV